MRYLLVILFSIFGVANAQTDTLEVNKDQLDSIQAIENYSGVVLFRPEQKHWDYSAGTYITHPPYHFNYYNLQNGQLIYIDEFRYYLSADGTLSDNIFTSIIHKENDPNTIYKSEYTRSGQYTEVTKTEIRNDTIYTYSAFYSENGKLMSHGHYVNESQDGKWPTYYYNDSIKVVEVWKDDRLVDMISDRIMFVGRSQEVISKEDYFEIIGEQNGTGWNLISIPGSYMNNEFNIAFVMYVENTGFLSFYDKGWEKNKWIEKLLKDYAKFQG